jgi:plastocyanin
MKMLAWMTAMTMFAAAALAQETATVKGVVKFKGTPPEPRAISFGAEKQCGEMHADKPPVYEDVVVGKDGALKWAFVCVKEGVTGEFAPPSAPVVIDQSGCIFLPHVVGVMVGQPVEFRNSDPVLHNVRAESKLGQSFNIAQPLQGMSTKRKFKTPETGVPLRCDVHFWMAAYVHVVPHPFFATTGADGAFEIKNLPAGNYTLEAWHEKFGTQTKPLAVKAGETAAVEFSFERK